MTIYRQFDGTIETIGTAEYFTNLASCFWENNMFNVWSEYRNYEEFLSASFCNLTPFDDHGIDPSIIHR